MTRTRDEEIERSLRDILDAIHFMDLVGEFEGGAMGDGDIVHAFQALREPFPDWLKQYLGEFYDPETERIMPS